MKKEIQRISTFIHRWFKGPEKKRIKWSEVYLAVAGKMHRLLVEGRRARSAARRLHQDLPIIAWAR